MYCACTSSQRRSPSATSRAVAPTMSTKSTVVSTRPGAKSGRGRPRVSSDRRGGKSVGRSGMMSWKMRSGQGEALEPICAEVPQAQAVDQGVLDQGGGRLGEQHLPPWPASLMRAPRMTSSPVYPCRRPDRFPRVHADAHPHSPALRPDRWPRGRAGMRRRGDRLRGAGEHHEERVTLRIDLVPLVRGKRGPQQDAVGRQDLGIALPEVHRQASAISRCRCAAP